MARLKLATVWLGGCSGCHMSLLDMDEFLLELADLADVVYSPLVDTKEYPQGVDLVLVEGAVCNIEHLHMIRSVRERSRVVMALGDCAVTGNVSALRNVLGSPAVVLERSYGQNADPPGEIPQGSGLVPQLLERVMPIHAVIQVDVFLPGCPPSGPTIRSAIEALMAGTALDLREHGIIFGSYGKRSRTKAPSTIHKLFSRLS